MPNWVKNRIIVGSPKFRDEIVKAHVRENKETGESVFDFNTIVKMPDDLNIEYGSKSSDGLALYIAKVNPACEFYGKSGEKMKDNEFRHLHSLLEKHPLFMEDKPLSEDRYKELAAKYGDKLEEVTSLGEKCYQNALKYGAINWYEWSVNNWGTKWNATDYVLGDKGVEFETAWDPALPAVVAMSKMHPNIRIAFLYSDEDIGNHVGYMLLTGGKVDYQGTFENQSRDAYKLAFDLWGCGDEYRYDEKKGTYERKPDDPLPTPKPGPVMA